jgi:hypothetical protein
VQVLAFDHDPAAGPQAMVMAKINAHDLVYMRIDVRLDNPTEWTMDLGNSQTNNGACGDSATNTFDSEIDVQGRTVRVCSDDTDPGSVRLSDLLLETRTWLEYEIFPGSHVVVHSNHNPLACTLDGGGMFQLTGFDTEANAPNDETYWLALNRVIADASRRGQGASVAEISLFYR